MPESARGKDSMLRFRVLGPIAVSTDTRDRTPRALKLRKVLAMLLMHEGELVRGESLIEELWSKRPPRSAVTTMQTYIYQLRKLLAKHGAEGMLETKPLGYTLRVCQSAFDLRRFEALVEKGRAAMQGRDFGSASSSLSEALALWRGPALADVEPGHLLQAQVARLEESRIRALELRVQSDLELGRHRELIGELKQLITAHPLHEWFYGRLMLALGRSGRRSEALEVYQGCRGVLREELRLEPSADLQSIQKEILSSG